MKNGELKQFLDTGWFSESTLFYNGYTYWCEGYWTDDNKEKTFHLLVQRYKSCLINDTYTKCYVDSNGDAIDFNYIIDEWFKCEDDAKEFFLKQKIFDGKSFWEIESKLNWYDEIGCIEV